MDRKKTIQNLETIALRLMGIAKLLDSCSKKKRKYAKNTLYKIIIPKIEEITSDNISAGVFADFEGDTIYFPQYLRLFEKRTLSAS